MINGYGSVADPQDPNEVGKMFVAAGRDAKVYLKMMILMVRHSSVWVLTKYQTFDPQAAGGLLAAVSADAVDEKLAQFQEAGYDARQVGVWVSDH